ncbi:hypothetical protein OG21DRAFT_943293 [Imleria badia]|nr:hypothetical protein OG21DRAFT_943293 [Imleria badia]
MSRRTQRDCRQTLPTRRVTMDVVPELTEPPSKPTGSRDGDGEARVQERRQMCQETLKRLWEDHDEERRWGKLDEAHDEPQVKSTDPIDVQLETMTSRAVEAVTYSEGQSAQRMDQDSPRNVTDDLEDHDADDEPDDSANESSGPRTQRSGQAATQAYKRSREVTQTYQLVPNTYQMTPASGRDDADMVSGPVDPEAKGTGTSTRCTCRGRRRCHVEGSLDRRSDGDGIRRDVIRGWKDGATSGTRCDSKRTR